MSQEDLISTVNKCITMNNNRALEVAPSKTGKQHLSISLGVY